MHIYAFGSVCRGEVTHGSDVDLLAVVEQFDPRFDPSVYSVYSYARIRQLWIEGNPFAWHLFLESRLLFAGDVRDYLRELGVPSPYSKRATDCEKFRRLFIESAGALVSKGYTTVFELSMIFLAIRNIATCFSLRPGNDPVFSRDSALKIDNHSLRIRPDVYKIFELARILCTRGYGTKPTDEEISRAISSLDLVRTWMDVLVAEVRTE